MCVWCGQREEFYSSREDPYAAADAAMAGRLAAMPFVAGGAAPRLGVHDAAAEAKQASARAAAAAASAAPTAYHYGQAAQYAGEGKSAEPAAYYGEAGSGAAAEGYSASTYYPSGDGSYDATAYYGQAGTGGDAQQYDAAGYYGAGYSSNGYGPDGSYYGAEGSEGDGKAAEATGAATATATSTVRATAAPATARGDGRPPYPGPRGGSAEPPASGGAGTVDAGAGGALAAGIGVAAAGGGLSLSDKEVADVFSLARHNRCKEVEALLERGVPVNLRDKHGNTILTIACQNGLKKMACVAALVLSQLCNSHSCCEPHRKVALRAGGDINTRNYKGNTPLHYCFTYGFGDTLGQYMLSKGADGTIRNNAGLTCFQGLEPAGKK